MSCFYCCTTSLFKLSEGRTQKYRMWQQTLKSVLNWASRWVSSSLTSVCTYTQNTQWYGADSIQASYVHISTDAWNYRQWTRSTFSSVSNIKYVILTCHTWMFSQVLNTLWQLGSLQSVSQKTFPCHSTWLIVVKQRLCPQAVMAPS